jgi:hypothetical protein
VANTIRDGDAKLAAAAMNQLLRWITDLHDGEQAPAPTFELFEEEDVNVTQAERDETLTRAGVNFQPQYWKRVYKLQEGDIADKPEVITSPVPASLPGPAVEFAERVPAPGITAREAAAAGAPVISSWLRDLRSLVHAHTDAQELQEALLDAYSELPTEDLTELMALAFELAHLQGRDQAAQESVRG